MPESMNWSLAAQYFAAAFAIGYLFGSVPFGLLLTRFAGLLPPDVFEAFVDEYRVRLLEAIGDTTPYFYPFKRILFWAARA